MEPVQGSFFKRFWEGNISLPISFWLVNVLGAKVVILSLVFLFSEFIDSLTSFSTIVLFVSTGLLYTLLALISIWVLVGLWRSAKNYIENPNKGKVWGYIAMFLVVIGGLQTVSVYVTSYVPQVVSFYKMAILGDPDIPEYKITVTENGSELKIEGGIKEGLLKDVKKILMQAPSITTINLESIGGRQGEAIGLYNFINNRNLNTVTNKVCLSACTIIFAGGKNRWIGVNGKLGFHSASFEGVSESEASELGKEILLKINTEKNIPIDFLNKSNKIKAEDMWYPNIDELKASNYITSKASLASSSLRIMEQQLIEIFKEAKASLPNQLDADTTLIDIKIKLNKVTSIHVLSQNAIENLQNMNNGAKVLENYVIKNSCKSKDIRDSIEIGIEYNYSYLHPNLKSEFASIKLPIKCY